MELKTIGRIAVGNLGFKIGGQIDDIDGAKGTLLRANTTTYAEALRDESDF